jgi:hypothetical protein
MKREPLTSRVARYLLRAPVEKRTYFLTMLAVFPPAQYPNAWRYSSNGGPPGCAMAFGAALRKLKVVNYQSTLSFDSEHLRAFELVR